MIPESISQKMQIQKPIVRRPHEQLEELEQSLCELNLHEHEQVKAFLNEYRLGPVRSNQPEELLDICSPTRQWNETTEFARNIYELPDGYVCLTSGEGEAFILYSLLDGKVYDMPVEHFRDLTLGSIEANWNSFFDLIEWYLE